MSYTSNQKFYINGVSSDSIGVWCDYLDIPPMAEQRYTDSNVGSDEDLAISDDQFEDIEYSINFHTFFREDYDNTDIYAFLIGAKNLEISELPGYYFKVKKVGGIQPSHLHGKRGDYTVEFTLAPFKYRSVNDEIPVSSGAVIENTGTRYSKPTIKCRVNGEGNITVNGDTMTVTTPSSMAVTIDSNRKIVYDDDGVILINSSAGFFPMLAVGQNIIELSGNISSVTMFKNERCY